MGIPEDIALFEQSLSELVIKYEQYFLGLEKREPLKLLAVVENCVRQYANVSIVNTMHKFKYNTLVARFCSYKQYWNRINRLIEEGKYSRDRFKLAMHQGKPPASQPVPEAVSDPRPDSEVSAIYRQYVEARKACSLPVDNITPDMIATALEKQKPAIVSKYGCDKVEFKVVIEAGAPKIKARPKL
jgi:hypothetical protein